MNTDLSWNWNYTVYTIFILLLLFNIILSKRITLGHNEIYINISNLFPNILNLIIKRRLSGKITFCASLKSCIISPVWYIFVNTAPFLEYNNFQIAQYFFQGLANQRVGFIHSLIQQIFSEHLLCARCYARHWVQMVHKTTRSNWNLLKGYLLGLSDILN